MVNSNTFLLQKGNSVVHRKRFSNRIVLNHLHENLKSILIGNLNIPYGIKTSNALNLKTSIYTLQKEFKTYKVNTFDPKKEFSMTGLDNFSLKLQASGFYSSTVELEKAQRLKQLKSKIAQFFVSCLLKRYKPNYQQRPLWEKEDQLRFAFLKPRQRKELKTTYGSSIRKKADALFSKEPTPKFSSKVLQQKQLANHRSALLMIRKNYSRLLEFRIFSFLSAYKKKYKVVTARMKFNKIQLRMILSSLKKVPLSFEKRNKYYYNKYKRLVWKRKKRKDRRKTGLLAFLRRRKRRLLFQFYIPRHFEINYKTFELIHLGDFDLNTTNSRIPYWLNLRRLLTFLSL